MADSTKFDELSSTFELREDNSFHSNSRGIIELKAEFLAEADEFLFLRKGEDVGAELIGALALTIQSLDQIDLSELVKDLYIYSNALERINKYYHKLKELISKRNKNPKYLKILCSPDYENSEACILYQKLGYEVKKYGDNTIKGTLRYYLNEKRYCVFIRTGDDSFTGFIGNNKNTIKEIKNNFESEWANSKDF